MLGCCRIGSIVLHVTVQGCRDLDSYPIRDTLSASDKEGQGRAGQAAMLIQKSNGNILIDV